MLLVFIFLSAFAVASHQKFRLQLERPIHWFPYRSSQDFPHHQVAPFRYPDQANPFGNTFAQHPAPQQLPAPLHIDFASGSSDWQDRINSNNQKKKETPALEGRTTVLDADDAQFRFYHYSYWKTATFTLTTTMNVTRVSSCIPISIYWGNSYSTPCTRKKREIAKDFLDIDPSEPQQVTMTTVPAIINDQLERRNRHLVYDRDVISSSKDDVTVRDETSHGKNDLMKKKKRYIFHHWVTITTATSYIFNTFYLTKIASPAGNGVFYCRPTGYPICS